MPTRQQMQAMQTPQAQVQMAQQQQMAMPMPSVPTMPTHTQQIDQISRWLASNTFEVPTPSSLHGVPINRSQMRRDGLNILSPNYTNNVCDNAPSALPRANWSKASQPMTVASPAYYPSVPATQTITQNTPLPKTPPTPTARGFVAPMNAPSKLWPTNAHGQVISPNTLRLPVTGVGSAPNALPNAAMGLPILFPVTPTLQNPSGLAPMHSLGRLSPSMTQTRPAHQTWQRAHGRALPANYYTLG